MPGPQNSRSGPEYRVLDQCPRDFLDKTDPQLHRSQELMRLSTLA